jgi:glycerol-3-phosphate cytidylyltransferase-like family protein
MLTNEDFQALGQMMDEKLAPIRADIAELRGRLDENEKSIRRVNQSVVVLEKEVKHDFKIIRENSGNWNERNRQIDRLQKTQEDHHDRIWALEQVAKASNQ